MNNFGKTSNNLFFCKIHINKAVALFGIIKQEMTSVEIRKQVKHNMVIAKLAISKYKYGKYKNLEMIFVTKLEMKSKGHK